MDFAIVYCVALTSYGKALYLHFYYLTIWTHCTCIYILSEIKLLLLLLLTSLIFSATGMDRSFHRVVSSNILRFAIAMCAFTSLEQSPSVDLREPRYLNCSTFSTGSLLTRMVMSSGRVPNYNHDRSWYINITRQIIIVMTCI